MKGTRLFPSNLCLVTLCWVEGKQDGRTIIILNKVSKQWLLPLDRRRRKLFFNKTENNRFSRLNLSKKMYECNTHFRIHFIWNLCPVVSAFNSQLSSSIWIVPQFLLFFFSNIIDHYGRKDYSTLQKQRRGRSTTQFHRLWIGRRQFNRGMVKMWY